MPWVLSFPTPTPTPWVLSISAPPVPTYPSTLPPTPTPTPVPRGHIYIQFSDEGWTELYELLEEYPHLRYDGLDPDHAEFSFVGYTLYFPCTDNGEVITSKRTGNVYPTQNCIAEHQAKCGPDYLPEIIPGEPGCLDTRGGAGYGVFYLDIKQLQLLDKPWCERRHYTV